MGVATAPWQPLRKGRAQEAVTILSQFQQKVKHAKTGPMEQP
jgi:hypothetical protein